MAQTTRITVTQSVAAQRTSLTFGRTSMLPWDERLTLLFRATVHFVQYHRGWIELERKTRFGESSLNFKCLESLVNI